jgi:acyl dehydratase
VGVVTGRLVRSPTRTVDDAELAALVRAGGYVHPLFTDASVLDHSPFDRVPLPGQALLLLMGGLAEQSGAYDEATLALVGMDVRFLAPLLAGDAFCVEVHVPADDPSTGARRVLASRWFAVRTDGTPLAEATVRFLVRGDADG